MAYSGYMQSHNSYYSDPSSSSGIELGLVQSTDIHPEVPITDPDTGPRIVLGIDYGTTYTGLAWMQKRDNRAYSLDDLNLFRTWPRRTEQKVPSKLSFSNTEAGRTQWGFDIDSKNSKVLQWTKLELEPRATIDELKVLLDLMGGLGLVRKLHSNAKTGVTIDPPRHITRNSEDIVTEYLGRVTREWYKYMTYGESGGKKILQNVPLDVVITHPVDWSYEAMNKTYRASVAALPKEMFPTLRDIYLVPEPEACALYTVQEMIKKDLNSLIPGECFVLCDAGGGTVDLASYRVDSIDPLSLTKIGVPSGRKSGATFIDKAFLKWMQGKLGNLDILEEDSRTGGHFIVKYTGKILLDQFEKHKHAFSGNETADIVLPRNAKVANHSSDEIDTGSIPVTASDFQSMFEQSVSGTVDLISRQVAQVENTRHGGGRCRVTNIFLAGGFSENPYLLRKVKDYARRHGNIEVQKAENGWSSVVKGAVLSGMGLGMPIPSKVSQCPQHYGICVSQAYESWKHDDQAVAVDPFHGKQMATDPLIWVIHRGDLIRPDKATTSNFVVECMFTSGAHRAGDSVLITIVSTRLEDPPSKMADLPSDSNLVVHMGIPVRSFDLYSLQRKRKANGGGRFYTALVDVTFQVSSNLSVNINYGDTTLKSYQTAL